MEQERVLLLSMITRLMKRDSGEVFIEGKELESGTIKN